MSRAEKVAEAQGLRAQGLKLREIAERMGSGISTVSTWLSDPDLSKQRANRERYRKPCPKCGRPMDGSNGFNGARPSTLCQECRIDEPHTVAASVNRRECMRTATQARRWPDEALLDAVRFFYEEHGETTIPTYLRLAPDMSLPSAPTIINRFGSWNEARKRAGVPFRAPRRTYTRLSNTTLAAQLRQAEALCGQAPSITVYDGIRACHPDLGLASSTLIRIRFGSWSAALSAALGSESKAAA